MVEELIPIVMFLSIALVLILFYYFKFLGRKELQRTVRIALERGQDLSPELLDKLGEPQKSPLSDLRRGLIALAIAAGLAAIGLALGQEEAIRPLLASAMLPLFIGLAYLVLWRLNASRQSD
ncbi:MAG: hypothetical protein HKN35_13325 [Woeseia sp.]|nr:hypothetical protein [Woeseia sp.]MBT8095853.1 hypothetical protein [Woeseia sp.]NNE61870.1 hypothetical protein [Woeseia sp.]NNL55107.1 hypothetical protein [Woeseia sp.]